MKIKVLFFAQFKDIFKVSERMVEMEGRARIEQLRVMLDKEAGGSSLQSIKPLFSLNESWADDTCELHDNDTVALLPPVSGG